MRTCATATALMLALIASSSAQPTDQRQTKAEQQTVLPKPSPAERVRCGLPRRILNAGARSACAPKRASKG